MKATFTTPALNCGGCVATVRAALSGLEGVQAVHVTLPTKRVEVAFDPAVTSAERIARALAAAGYPPDNTAPAASAVRSGFFDAVLL